MAIVDYYIVLCLLNKKLEKSINDLVLVNFPHRCDAMPNMGQLREYAFVLALDSGDLTYHDGAWGMQEHLEAVVVNGC